MTRTRIVLGFALRAAVFLLLSGGLLWAAGTEAAVVGTIAATVLLVAPILAGCVLTWVASIARVDGHPATPWLLTQAAVVLVLALAAPVVIFPAPLVQSATVVWIFTAFAFLSGLIEVIGGAFGAASRIAGISLLVGAVLLVLVTLPGGGTGLLPLLGPVGVLTGLMGLGLGGAAVRAGRS